jgi:hypothetical protein
MEKFVQLSEVLRPTGVYALLNQGKVVYVGKSKNIFRRLSEHYSNQVRVRKGKPCYGAGHGGRGPAILFDDVRVKYCAIDRLDAEETKLIQEHLPPGNVHHVVPRYDMRGIPAFQELLKRARARGVPNYLRRGF